MLTIVYTVNTKNLFTCLSQPSKEMSMMTPMNCVKRMRGVKKDHTGHSAMLKLRGEKQVNTIKLAILPQRFKAGTLLRNSTQNTLQLPDITSHISPVLPYLQEAARKAAVVMGGMAGYSWS